MLFGLFTLVEHNLNSCIDVFHAKNLAVEKLVNQSYGKKKQTFVCRKSRDSTRFTLTNGSVVDEGFGKNGVKMIWSNTTKQNLIREVIVSHLHRSSVDVIKDNKIFPVNMLTKNESKRLILFI